MHLNKFSAFIFFMLAIEFVSAQSRRIINVPDIAGYQTLKCDFHMHTVFSDGTVWPTVRVMEAWEEGLDAIAITDHIEYLPHSKDIVSNHNRSFEIAEPLSKEMDILLVRAAEITRNMPPGHLNALFIKNANLLERDDVTDALREAREQGAFIFWNHPGWKAQQPDTTIWWEEHSRLLKNDLLHGIEVFNGELCPEALDWANDKKLTMFGNTDGHGPMDVKNGHRPLTLVFVKSRSLSGIKEALFSRRTVVYYENTLVGKADYLEPLFFGSLEYDKSPLRLKNEQNKVVRIKNNSDINYELELVQPGIGFEAPKTISIKAHHVTLFELSGNSDEVSLMKNINIYYRIKNLLVSSDEDLVITFSFQNN